MSEIKISDKVYLVVPKNTNNNGGFVISNNTPFMTTDDTVVHAYVQTGSKVYRLSGLREVQKSEIVMKEKNA